jgi:hypothetical protein
MNVIDEICKISHKRLDATAANDETTVIGENETCATEITERYISAIVTTLLIRLGRDFPSWIFVNWRRFRWRFSVDVIDDTKLGKDRLPNNGVLK